MKIDHDWQRHGRIFNRSFGHVNIEIKTIFRSPRLPDVVFPLAEPLDAKWLVFAEV